MTETYFKEGDKVTCPLRGYGFVKKITPENNYPIQVKFIDESSSTYTLDGRVFDHYNRSLHQGHIDLPEPVLIPIVEYTKGEVIWYNSFNDWFVGFYESETWVKNQKGNFLVFKEIRKFDNPPTFKA